MKKPNKKAQLVNNVNMLTFGSIMFVVAVIVLVVGAAITTTIGETISRGTNNVVNESDLVNLLWGNNTNMTLDNQDVSVNSVYNCSTGADFTTIDPGNYTVFTQGLIGCDDNSTFPKDGDAVCVNYTYLNQNAAFNTSQTGSAAFLTFGDFLSVIAIIIVLVVIIGLLLGVIVLFARNR